LGFFQRILQFFQFSTVSHIGQALQEAAGWFGVVVGIEE